ncbi:uncharacterized protein LOC111597268 [Drosophila hydei]|uniref:Uncharacterized protein LOC111597268 n=1 Tax=Drosophila hydei TaxID=7224 RepID=A0A6J2SVW3_DROHY|nr:uncharacterized protein LOC111597268 [Drosophila hydei]
MYRHRTLLLLAVFFVMHITTQKVTVDERFFVENCPNIKIITNLTKEMLLGVWYAFASSPIFFNDYQRRCASYNVKDSPYFKTNIVYYDEEGCLITYSCLFNKKRGMYFRKLRILTRTRTPTSTIMYKAMEFTDSIHFPINALRWLRAEAFCFEWYLLKFDSERQPMSYQAPFNQHGPLGR